MLILIYHIYRLITLLKPFKRSLGLYGLGSEVLSHSLDSLKIMILLKLFGIFNKAILIFLSIMFVHNKYFFIYKSF